MPILEVLDLSTHFETRQGLVKAVDGVSFYVNPGEVLGIVGESGSGKSVTSLSIMRLIDPPGRIVKGRIFLDDGRGGYEDLALADEARMQMVRGDRIAMIFQDPMTALNPYLRIGVQLTEVLELRRDLRGKAARDAAIAMLTKVGIPDAARRIDDYPHQLSGGMRQRALIAMALLSEPRLLIADEPTTALDVTIQAQILELIRERKEEMDLGVILITHDLGVIAEMADRVLVMYGGRIVEEGPVDAIFNDPRHPYTIGLARSISRLDAPRDEPLYSIPGTPPSPAALPQGCPFHLRCAHKQPICEARYPEARIIRAPEFVDEFGVSRSSFEPISRRSWDVDIRASRTSFERPSRTSFAGPGPRGHVVHCHVDLTADEAKGDES